VGSSILNLMVVGNTYNQEVRQMAGRRSEQQAEADRRHAVRVSLKLNKIFDYEIVQWLGRQENKQAAIKEAILYYISEQDAGSV